MMKINKMERIAVTTGEHLSMQLHLLVEAKSQKYLSGDQNSAQEEKKRHDLAVEKYQAAYEKYHENQHILCFEAKQGYSKA